jgi:hypothetical protein
MEKRSAPSPWFTGKLVGALILCLATALPARAQLILGQYEDEAPLASWNVFGAVSAPALGLGGIRIGRAFNASISTTNPALLLSLPRSSASLTGSYTFASLFRYSIVNTGVLATTSNLSVGSFAFETGSFAYRFGGWAVAFTADVLENFARPSVRSSYASGGTEVYAIGMEQSGVLRAWNIAAARRLGRRLSLGVGLNFVDGRLDRTVSETWPEDGITITDDKSERFRGFFVNAGLRAELSPSVSVSLAVRTPYLRTAHGDSLVRYEASGTGTDIRIEAEARNEYRQPWVAGAGLDWRWSEAWSLAADLIYFGWSRYSVLFFDEPVARNFRDAATASVGVEHGMKGRVGGKTVQFPIRLGLAYDGQPMDDIHSSYIFLTLGAGIRLGPFAADLSGSIGRESGSGNALRAGRVALGLSYAFDDR